MGTLFYGASRLRVDFEDRALIHLQHVMTAKLRRGEGFMLSWSTEPASGSGRFMVWIHPATDLQFSFEGVVTPKVNREWINELALLANTASGLHVTEEGELKPVRAGA